MAVHGEVAPRGRRAARKPAVTVPDRETRARVFEEARALFAARGYRQVTVREICTAANANVASINYHFGDKWGLYGEVLDEAIRIMRQTSLEAVEAGEGGTPEEGLRAYIRVFLERTRSGKAPWIHQLMTHELAEPTDALDEVIAQVIKPRTVYLQTLVAGILQTSTDDPRVMRCVMSVQAQFHPAMTNPVLKRLAPGFAGDAASIDRLVQHIADFSIGGIRSLRSHDTPADV